MRGGIRIGRNRNARRAILAAAGLVAFLGLAGNAAASPSEYEFVLIASENDPGFVANGFDGLALNDLGQVAYIRVGKVNNPTFAHGGAVLLGDGVSSRTIVDGSTPVPAGFFQTFLNLGDRGSARFQKVDLNASGQVVFEARLNNRVDPFRLGDTGDGVFATDIDGTLVEVGVADEDCCGPEPEFSAIGRAAINDRGTVSLAVRDQTSGTPTLILTRHTSDPAGSSAIALQNFNDSVYVPELGRQVGTQINLDLFSDLNNDGAVVGTGFYSFVPAVGDMVSGRAILAGPAVPPNAVVVGDGSVNPFSVSSSAAPEINGPGLISFLASPSGLNTSLFGVDLAAGMPGPLLTASSGIDQVSEHDTNDAGDFVASISFDGFNKTGVFTGPDFELDRVLASGDTLFGRPVLHVRSAQINDRGQIALFVIFGDDSSEAIVRADPVGSSGAGPCKPSLPGLLEAPCLPAVVAELEAGSPVTIGRTVTFDGDETALAFALRFLSPDGDVTVALGGATEQTISASGDGAEDFAQRVVLLPLPVAGAHELSFTLDGPAGSVAQIGDIALLIGADRDPIDGGTFADGTGQPFASVADAGWTVTGSGTATLHVVPEPDVFLSAAAALATLLTLSRCRRRSGPLVVPPPHAAGPRWVR
jgi:hypothetical protein